MAVAACFEARAALDAQELAARESELVEVVRIAAAKGEDGNGEAKELDLPELEKARGELAEIARIRRGVVAPTRPVVVSGSVAVAPAPAWDAGAPHVNGPDRYGATPNRDFSYTFPVRGSRKGLTFSVASGALPKGVTLDAHTGVLSGRTAVAGEHRFAVKVKNAEGETTRGFTLVIGEHARGQTPLLGWTSWNACHGYVDQKIISEAARLLVERGYAARGYAYVNIDSCWQGIRDGGDVRGLQPNRAKFPDMAGLVREIHGRGLKVGIYSTPSVIAWGGGVCSGLLLGSTGHPLEPVEKRDPNHDQWWGGCGQKRFEKDDAAQWAAWGFDYLKYDWGACDIPHVKAMREALDATGRDFQLCICTCARFENRAAYPIYAQMIRSAVDVTDQWRSIAGPPLRAARLWAPACGRGCWYDLDMMALGAIALDRDAPIGEKMEKKFENRLTREEQVTHFALWAFLPSPLQLSCDLRHTDPFTYDLVCAEELLAINQDASPSSATFDRAQSGVWVWERPLADGSRAWAFTNVFDTPCEATWTTGACRFRDVLACRDLGEGDGLKLVLPPHATRVIRGVVRGTP